MRRSHHVEIDNRSIQWHVLKMLWPYLVQFRRRVLFAMLFLVLAKVASISLPFFLKHIVDQLDLSSEPGSVEQLQTYLLTPLALVFAYGAARFLNVLFNELRDTLFGRVTEGTMRTVGLKAFEHLHRLELDFHLNRRTGGLSRDLERGTSSINSLMRFMVFNIVPTLVEVCIVIGVMLVNYGWEFATIIFFSVTSYVFFSVKATEWRTEFVRKANVADTTSNSRAIDSLLNYETVKYFTNERYEAARYDSALAEWEQAKRKNRLSLFALNGGQALIIALGTTSMLALAAQQVSAQTMTLGDFVLVNAFMMQIFIPLNFLGFVYREIKGSLAGIEALFGLIKQKPKIQDEENAGDLRVVNGEIELRDMSFHYHPERPILNQLNLTLKPNQKTAIVGASGSGKSTFVKLLFRFYDPVTGKILIDGQDIRSVTQHSLRKTIGVVPQDTVLFNDTILENVRYGRPSASDEEVNEAIRMAHLESFIEQLPKGLQTVVGERGLKLSGGEKQRVAIARTILKQPKILVFDEATSSLDSRAEKAIMTAVDEVSRGRTSIIIAHRLSTIVNADNILVLDQGTLIEQGTHEALLSAKGAYSRLWFAQQNRDSDGSSDSNGFDQDTGEGG